MGSHDWSRWAAGLTGVLILAGCSTPEEGAVADVVPQEIAEVGTLLAVTDPTFPPAQFRSPIEFQGVQRGDVTGFEVDLLEAAAEELGLEVEWVDAPFEDVLEQVSSGQANLGAAAIGVTDERLADYTFVTFFQAGTQWAVQEPNSAGISPNAACGKRVAVQRGTTQADDLAERSADCEDSGQDPIQVLEYERQDQATAAVLSGLASAFLADTPAVQWAIRQSGGSPSATGSTDVGRLIKVGKEYSVLTYGWAVDPEDEELAEALLTGLQAVVDSGEYEEILEFWGVQDGAIPAEDIKVVGGG